jgi:hypothetical protein
MAFALSAEPATVRARWAAALGRPVVLVRSVERARAALLAAAGVRSGEPVALPANATRGLVEAIKERGARPRFRPLGHDLSPTEPPEARIAWAQPFAGLADAAPVPGAALWVDHADTVPDPGGRAEPPVPEAALWGLHLAPDPGEAGAVLAFASPELAERVGAQLGADDQPDWLRAAAQLGRLAGLADRQRAALAEAWRGLSDAAGLPMLAPSRAALGHGVAVGVPGECDPATFYSYVRGENTPVRWLPEARPVHYAAARELGPAWRSSAEHLARWLVVPVGPERGPEETAHAILGVVKAADYLGVRWRTAPARAAAYARAMVERYGPEHDAYRPAFEV